MFLLYILGNFGLRRARRLGYTQILSRQNRELMINMFLLRLNSLDSGIWLLGRFTPLVGCLASALLFVVKVNLW